MKTLKGIQSPSITLPKQVQAKSPRPTICAKVEMEFTLESSQSVEKAADLVGPVNAIAELTRNVNCALDSLRSHIRPFLPRQR